MLSLLSCFCFFVSFFSFILLSFHISFYLCNFVLCFPPPCNRVLSEKLIVAHIVKKFAVFYATRRFITVFTAARHWALSWAWWIHFTPSHPTSLRSIPILSSHLRLSLQVFGPKICIDFSSPMCVLHAPSTCFLIWLPIIILGEAFKVWSSSVCSPLQLPAFLGGCIQKFPDWPPGARTANGTAFCH
jgi:hypothetical protein